MCVCGLQEKGNEAFKGQRYPEAVQHYTEALKRGPPTVNPEAHKLYRCVRRTVNPEAHKLYRCVRRTVNPEAHTSAVQ